MGGSRNMIVRILVGIEFVMLACGKDEVEILIALIPLTA
jgi:hypothetical protein